VRGTRTTLPTHSAAIARQILSTNSPSEIGTTSGPRHQSVTDPFPAFGDGPGLTSHNNQPLPTQRTHQILPTGSLGIVRCLYEMGLAVARKGLIGYPNLEQVARIVSIAAE
jgi:hypothetical protein